MLLLHTKETPLSSPDRHAPAHRRYLMSVVGIRILIAQHVHMYIQSPTQIKLYPIKFRNNHSVMSNDRTFPVATGWTPCASFKPIHKRVSVFKVSAAASVEAP